MANMTLAMISSTGHLAMFQAVTAADPMPSACPTLAASAPVTTTIRAEATSRTSMTRVTASRIGVVFQSGLPSGTS